MLILVNNRLLKKNFLKFNKFPAILYNEKNKNILLEINNNNYYYNILKINLIIEIKLINIIYKVLIKNISYHPYKKLIINIDLFKI